MKTYEAEIQTGAHRTVWVTIEARSLRDAINEASKQGMVIAAYRTDHALAFDTAFPKGGTNNYR